MKKFFVITLIVAVIAGSFSFINADPIYKNLKVLPKNTTHEQMDSIMVHFAKSLGVKCNYCHVRDEKTDKFDFARDGNVHKDIARSMMKMTNRINKKYFGSPETPIVTCFSCHNGQESPGRFPPKDEEE